MILQRFYDESLAQASYLIGCPAAGEAMVIDPARDVAQYLSAAAAAGLRIVAVTETHIHADFVSGSRELAARAGATLYLSDEGGEGWRYGYAAEARATFLHDGDEIRIGGLRVRAIHTPGHTPEHLSFMLTDLAATDRPMGVFTGDFVFVGDVGRPDLLERAAGVAGGAEVGARQLFDSLQRFKALPDYLQIWPGHGAGSACGRGLSAVPQSTIGFERIANWAFAFEDEERFVEEVLRGQPEAPRYFAVMKRINRDGPPLLAGLDRPESLADERIVDLVRAGELVVDVRPADAFAAAHVPGTINIPLDGGFVTWSGTLLPYDRPIFLLAPGAASGCPDRAVRGLRSIGLDRLAGCLDEGALAAWRRTGREVGSVPQVDPDELEQVGVGGPLALLDVRGRTEWESGHLPGARHVPLAELTGRLEEIPRDATVVTYCQGGARSAIAASLLRAAGLASVANLRGGMDACRARAVPVEGEKSPPVLAA